MNVAKYPISPQEVHLPPSLPPLPVQRSVLNRFGHVGGIDRLFPGQVGDGAGQFEDAVMGTGGEAQGVEGLFQEVSRLPIQLAVGAYMGWGHGGVMKDAGSLVAFRLDGVGRGDSFPDGG